MAVDREFREKFEALVEERSMTHTDIYDNVKQVVPVDDVRDLIEEHSG